MRQLQMRQGNPAPQSGQQPLNQMNFNPMQYSQQVQR
jgi:hypothetical protein